MSKIHALYIIAVFAWKESTR